MVPPPVPPTEGTDNSHVLPSRRKARRRWPLVVCLGFLLTGGTLLGIYLLRPGKYTARVLLSVQATPPRILFTTDEVRPDYATYQRTQATLIRSRLVLNTALRNPKVADMDIIKTQLDPVEWLEQRINVDYVGGSEIMRISISGDNPDEISTLVDAVTAAYLTEIVNKEQIERLARLDQLKEVSNRYEALLKDKRKSLRTLAEQAGSTNPETLSVRHRFQQEQLGWTRRKLQDLKTRLHETQLEALARQAKDRNGGEPVVPEEQILEGIQKDTLVAQYQARIAKAEEALDLLESKSDRSDNKHAPRQQYQEVIKTQQAALAARKQRIRPRIEADLRQRVKARAADQAAQAADQIAFLSKQIELLEADEERLGRADQRINRLPLDLESYKEEIAQAELVAKRITKEIATMDVELKAPARIKLLDGVTVSYKSW